MTFLLDANVFIEANNRYYGLDFCPHFWRWIDKHYNLGEMYSISPVYAELKTYGDSLSDWVKNNKKYFLPITDKIYQQNMAKISQFCIENYDMNNKRNLTFLDSADPWLIAKAIEDNSTIITHEKYSQESKKIIIPNLCREFDVNYMDTFELLRKFDDCFK